MADRTRRVYCRNCRAEVAEQAVVCVACGVPPQAGRKFCQHCGAETDPAAELCVRCGVRLAVADETRRSRLIAGLLGVLLGVFGVHRFYLGYTGIGIAQLVLGVLGLVTCGVTSVISWLWGLIEGVMILTGSIARDAHGQPLKE